MSTVTTLLPAAAQIIGKSPSSIVVGRIPIHRLEPQHFLLLVRACHLKPSTMTRLGVDAKRLMFVVARTLQLKQRLGFQRIQCNANVMRSARTIYDNDRGYSYHFSSEHCWDEAELKFRFKLPYKMHQRSRGTLVQTLVQRVSMSFVILDLDCSKEYTHNEDWLCPPMEVEGELCYELSARMFTLKSRI